MRDEGILNTGNRSGSCAVVFLITNRKTQLIRKILITIIIMPPFQERSTKRSILSIVDSTKFSLPSIVISIAPCGQTIAHCPHPRQAEVMNAPFPFRCIELTKQMPFVHVPHFVQRSVTRTETPGILLILSLIRGCNCGSIFHKQQQGQQ